MFEEITINESDAVALLNKEESHFFDATRKQGKERSLGGYMQLWHKQSFEV